MADLATIRLKVRRRVRDPDPPPTPPGAVLYVDGYYDDAIDFALQKLSLDFNQSPQWTITTVPAEKEFLLIKLATIEMCYIRGGEATDAEEAASAVDSITVPDLTVDNSDSEESGFTGPKYWLDLADRLEKEYDKEVDKQENVNPVGLVGVYEQRRRSLTTGGKAPYALSKPPEATTITAFSYAAGAITLEWEPVYFSDFYRYEAVIRKDGVANSTEILLSEPDNHKTEKEISKTLTAGIWLIRVDVYNMDELKTSSSEASVTVT